MSDHHTDPPDAPGEWDAEAEADTLIALSRLLDGALPTEAASKLRATIAADPAVAAQWKAMQALAAALPALPTELPPPPVLDAAVLAEVTRRPPTRRPRWPWAIAALAVAAAVLLATLPPPAPTPVLTLVSGTQRVQGERLSIATLDGHQISLTGAAELRLRPDPEAPMKQTLAGAAAGAFLTVLVYEGSALVSPPDGSPTTTIHAGEERRFPTTTQDGLRAPHRASTAAAAPTVVELDGATLSPEDAAERIRALQDEVAALELERDMQQGALEALEGSPQDFPEDLPEAFTEAGMRSRLQAIVDGNDQLELVGMDCDEYPCMAIVRDHSGEGDWMRAVQSQVAGQWEDQGDVGMSMWVNQTHEDPQKSINLAGLAVRPAGEASGGSEDDPVQVRTNWRMDGWMQEVVGDAVENEPSRTTTADEEHNGGG